jgi:hypothetical protein
VTKKRKKEKFDQQEEIFCSRKRRPRERRQNLVPITFVSFLDPLSPRLFVCGCFVFGCRGEAVCWSLRRDGFVRKYEIHSVGD